ncbi:putative TetR family transcriptional regulator [Nocardia brasiliensis NBRC 14402]|uniref:TetR/AcrR family transcriptional regulator n=2 Tax=Nocardia brasiliensis TaxID=37326 RepID=UPI0003120FEB|nr:TetR/AcrR family transcriptional regulator [Nocardia brasiliensis]GAJ82733.1 putative TetR family transcriptional regulator [Nocardia brasiliensis NBRC 14402]SUB09567.1 Bacterial regulatory proteins, tetR family [Nocardia brasiliensis]
MRFVDNVCMVETQPLRERLVDAGVDLLEEVGAAQLGLRAITRAAGVSHGAPRRHFPTHRALLAAVAARGFADLIDRFAAVDVDTAPPRARLARMSVAYVEFAGERPEMFTLMFRHDLLEGSGENLRGTTLPLYGRFAALVGAAGPGAADPAQRAIALWTNLHGIAALRANRSLALVGPTVDVRALVDRALDLHLS